MKSGIYQIRNILDNRVYIGSSINIGARFATHKLRLRKNIHHSNLLQNAWNKYGYECFVFETLELVELNRLIEREQFYIDSKRACIKEYGYNINPIAGNSLGTKLSEETRRKMSISRIGKKMSPESKLKMSIAAKNRKPVSDEARERFSKNMLGKKIYRLKLKLINLETLSEHIVNDINECLDIPMSKRTTIYAVINGNRESINGYKIINLRHD